MIIDSHSEKETIKFAKDFAKKFKGRVVLLIGDMGTGKTHFTKGFAAGLGLEDFMIKSPTYTYIRKYEAVDFLLYHIDLYRLDGHDEMLEEEILELMEGEK